MNFGKNAITRALKAGASRGEKYSNFLVLAFARALFFCALLGGALFAAAGFAIGLGGSDAGDDGGRKKAKDDDLAHIYTPINLEARGRFQPLQAGQVPLPTC